MLCRSAEMTRLSDLPVRGDLSHHQRYNSFSASIASSKNHLGKEDRLSEHPLLPRENSGSGLEVEVDEMSLP